MDNTEMEKTARPNKSAMLLKNCGKIVWLLSAFYVVVMFFVSIVAANHAILEPMSSFLSHFSSAAVASIGGLIFGAVLMGFGELIDILSDMRDTMKQKAENTADERSWTP